MSVCIITSIFIFVIYVRVGIFGLCQLKQLLPPLPPTAHITTSVPTRASLQQNISLNRSVESVIFNGRTIRLTSPIVLAIQCKTGTHLMLSLKVCVWTTEATLV